MIKKNRRYAHVARKSFCRTCSVTNKNHELIQRQTTKQEVNSAEGKGRNEMYNEGKRRGMLAAIERCLGRTGVAVRWMGLPWRLR